MREYKFLLHEPIVTIGGERSRSGPPGVFGGKPGAPFRGVIKKPNGEEITMSGYTKDGKLSINFRTFWKVEADSTVVLQNAGGGGYGNPMERDPSMVLSDVIDGYVSLHAAGDVYGVAIDGREIDDRTTEKLRKKE